MPIFTGYIKIWGETNGLYTPEFGLGLYTMFFTLSLFLFMSLYAALENKQNEIKIESEKQRAVNEAKTELADLVTNATEKILRKKLDSKSDQEYIKESLAQVK